MSTNKSEHLNLHLWEPEDDFLREEFKENFTAIDRAVGEVTRQVHLLELITTNDSSDLDFDWSGLDLTPYSLLTVSVGGCMDDGSSGTLLRLNHCAEEVYFLSSNPGTYISCRSGLVQKGYPASVRMTITIWDYLDGICINTSATTIPRVLTDTAWKGGTSGGVSQAFHLAQLTSIQLLGSGASTGKFLAGTKLTLSGTRK